MENIPVHLMADTILIIWLVIAIVQNVKRGTIAIFLRRWGVALFSGCFGGIGWLTAGYLIDGKADVETASAVGIGIVWGYMWGSGWAFNKQDKIHVERLQPEQDVIST